MDEVFQFDDESLKRAAQAARLSFKKGSRVAGNLRNAFASMEEVNATLRDQCDVLANRFPMFAHEYDALRADMSTLYAEAAKRGMNAGRVRAFAYRELRVRFGVRRSVYIPHLAFEQARQWLRDEAIDAYVQLSEAAASPFVAWLIKRGTPFLRAVETGEVVDAVRAELGVGEAFLAALPLRLLEKDPDIKAEQLEAVKAFQKFSRCSGAKKPTSAEAA